MDNKIFVGNLSFRINREKLKELFSPYGEVKEAIILRERKTGKSRGMGFVEFEHEFSANNAFAEMNNKEIFGRQIKINSAQPRKTQE